jgi:hypothetical protein
MNGRKARERRSRAERSQDEQVFEIIGNAIDFAIFEEIEPGDPRFGSFGPNATRETLDEALRRGELHPDCPLCQEMLAHRGPSILNRVVPDTNAEG